MKLQFFVFICIAYAIQIEAQRPFIKASNPLVDIRVDDELFRGQWTIVPEAKPDVYEVKGGNKRITFYTDMDSITFTVQIGAVIDFDIVLNGVAAWTQIKCIDSYLDVLKKGKAYDNNDTCTFPRFEYQAMNNTNLVALRHDLKLDSIAGTGNEVSKVLNLMHWIHNLIPHDGNHENPTIKNAMSMIQVCKNDKRGLNCRGLATVLNECYLSLGMKSRFVTCMPKDTVFQDCHVINMVWIAALDKWIWVDPTNDAYVMDENGVLLSIEEVRHRLIVGGTLIVNPDANWNHKSSVSVEDYLYNYMAKNLYRLESPIVSQYDTETNTEEKSLQYIELIPLDGFQQKPKYKKEYNSKFKTTYHFYKTNNAEVFWKKE